MMEAIALFGSNISGYVDHKSDLDLLVVCENNRRNNLIKDINKGLCNVSYYTPKQLQFMQLRGSLFIQHLKYESFLYHDEEDRFRAFLNKSKFVPPNQSELRRCRASIINALHYPKIPALNCFIGDYLYVLARDYFIKYFARRKQIIFNVKELSKLISSEFELFDSEENFLLDLRDIKHTYRSFSKIKRSQISKLEHAKRKLKSILGIEYIIPINLDDFNNISKLSLSSRYDLLRYVEALRIAFPSFRLEEQVEILIDKMIKNPNHYSSTNFISGKFLSYYIKRLQGIITVANNANQADSFAFSCLHSET